MFQDYLSPFQFGVFEVEDDARIVFGNAEIVENLADMLIAYLLNGLDLNDEMAFDFQVWNVIIYMYFTIIDGIDALLGILDALMGELDAESPFIRFFP